MKLIDKINDEAPPGSYYGYVDVSVANTEFVMFSNNDDFVAQTYFKNGPNAYESFSLQIWTAIAKQSPVVFDVGAYTGVYSLAAASANPRTKIYAFEPLTRVFNRITINKDVNKLSNINIFNVAVSNEIGSTRLNVYSGESILVTGSSIIDDATDRIVHDIVDVPVTTLDEFVATQQITAKIPLIKIDAEGAEHLILEGAETLINSNTPTILCEFLPVAKTEQIEKMLLEHKYNIFHINDEEQKLTECEHIQMSDKINHMNTLITTYTYEEVQEILNG